MTQDASQSLVSASQDWKLLGHHNNPDHHRRRYLYKYIASRATGDFRWLVLLCPRHRRLGRRMYTGANARFNTSVASTLTDKAIDVIQNPRKGITVDIYKFVAEKVVCDHSLIDLTLM
jgi:hypothetical protein